MAGVSESLVERNDPRLEALLRAEGRGVDREVERVIVNIARPVIGAILSRYLRSRAALPRHELDDIAATIDLRLVAKLRAVVRSPEDAVRDVESYVATLTYNAINDHLRRAFPERARLKNQLRYVMTRDPRLALWNVASTPVAGLRAWNGRSNHLADVPGDARFLRHIAFDRGRFGDALAEILGRAGEPVLFDALVAFCAELWRIAEPSRPSARQTAALTATATNTATGVETRQYVRALWREIRQLRPMQRVALLMNLRSGEQVNVISLVVVTGIASFEDVAAAVELSPAELTRIWNDLPLEDLRIAEHLKVSRQQVINLRKSARERLSRRMSRGAS